MISCGWWLFDTRDIDLRGRKHCCDFADMAAYAVPGTGATYLPIGSADGPHDMVVVKPDRREGNYFMSDASAGVVIPLAADGFRYPHPHFTPGDFLQVSATTCLR